jgi:hypothetical protein
MENAVEKGEMEGSTQIQQVQKSATDLKLLDKTIGSLYHHEPSPASISPMKEADNEEIMKITASIDELNKKVSDLKKEKEGEKED